MLFAAIGVLLIVGFFLRLQNLADKEFWHDESFTALVISGRTTNELKAEIGNKIVSFANLEKYRTLTDNSNPSAILKVIGEDEPGHAPLFYFAENLFCSIFGASPFSMRMLCVLISVCTLPAIYWAAREIYESTRASLLALGLASLSPLLIYYAQEARDYSLGILFMVVSTASLVTALRKNSKYFWAGYAVSLVAGLYSWLFMTIVMAAHVLYFLANWPVCKNQVKQFATCVALGVASFAPWALFISQHMDSFKKAYDWMQPTLTMPELVTVWLAIPYKSVALFGFKTAKIATLLFFVTVVEVSAVLLALKPLWNKKWTLLFILTVWFAIFAGQDLLTGGARSAVFRYQLPVLICTLMLLPTLFETMWTRSRVAKVVASLLLLFIFGVEILSDFYMLNTRIWPDKAIAMRFTLPLSDVLHKESDALLIAEESKINPTELLDLSYLVSPTTKLLFVTGASPVSIPDAAKIYVWNGSDALIKQLKSDHKIEENIGGFPYITKATR